MWPSYVTEQSLTKFIKEALHEDVRDGDHTSLATIPANARNRAKLIFKDDGIVAGMELAGMIFHEVNPDLEFTPELSDGDAFESGQEGFRVRGNSIAILTAERLVLNCMQRMSGIATLTHRLNELIRGTNAKLLDTRKTTPNFRMLEKWAVMIGGGVNHRYGLWDMILIKDNHIDFAGGIEQAILAASNYRKTLDRTIKIEVETRNLREVGQALNTGLVDRIMLDNMSVNMMEEAVRLIDGKVETEASGGITEDTIRRVAETGVDFISVGALTHSAGSLDMSLKAI